MYDDDELTEPTTIDEARLQMCKQLHRAIYGEVWARPETPEQVWHRLLAVVSDLSAPARFAIRIARDHGATIPGDWGTG